MFLRNYGQSKQKGLRDAWLSGTDLLIHINLFIIICIYACLFGDYAHVYVFTWDPEEGLISFEAGVTHGCELLAIGSRNQT